MTPISIYLLHGTWLPKDRSFFLWGEDSTRSGRLPRRIAQKSTPKHPFLAPLFEVELAARGLLLTESIQSMLLPSMPGTAPLPSPELNGSGEPTDAAAELMAWNVAGLCMAPTDVLPWLASQVGTPSSIALRFGSDLRYWCQAARFAIELIVRERYIPTADAEREEAHWRLLLDGEERLGVLVNSLPPVSLAVVPAKGSPAQFTPPVPHAFLTEFLHTSADALIRSWLGGATAGRRALDRTLAEEWAGALAAPTPTVLARKGWGPFCSAIANWTGNTASKVGASPFRTCFRLDPPPASDEDPHAPWALRLFLQANDDPSLLVPAAEIWRERGATLRYLNRRFDHPQERLLADLNMGARQFRPIDALLQQANPEVLSLSPTEAHLFLTEGAPLLQDVGLGVLLPAGWNAKPALSVRARVKSPRNAKPGTLGLDQVLDVDWGIALGDEPIRLSELRRLARLKLPLIRLRGHWVELDPERLQDTLSLLEGQSTLTVGKVLRLSAEAVEQSTGLPVSQVEADGPAAGLLDQLSGPVRPEELPPPTGLCAHLRPYQARGFSWLAFLRRYGIGACLADDMGLGKTVQLIALLLHERETVQVSYPTLLICPTSLVGNWQRELARFAPSLKVLVHHGADRRRGDEFTAAIAACDVVISTYALAHRDSDSLTAVNWAGVVLDEAQNIKNADSRQSQGVRALSAGYRIALTGTPVENRLSELWSIMDFLNPGYLGSAGDFHTRFAVPIERYQDEPAAGRLRTLVQPFILRRLKTDPTVISDLPQKLDQPVYVSLSKEQASLYAAVVEEMLSKIDAADGIERRGLVLAALSKLKQICNHPAHFLKDGSPLADRSGKLERLEEMLEEVLAEGDRALIFTQFAEMGALLRDHLVSRFGQEVLFLHGNVPPVERSRLVERFQHDEVGPPLFILTLKAGGVGLNLTRANHVFHFDRWWNPAVENQATDRAFRIGQQRMVMVHRLITAGTVEEKIDALIAGKQQLANQVVTAGEAWLTELTTQQLRALFTLDRE